MTPKERARLRGLANGIDTVLQIGKDGIGENLIHQADITLEARALIKGRVLDACMDYTPRTAAETLARATGSEVVQVIGSKFVLYRKKAAETPKKHGKPCQRKRARTMENHGSADKKPSTPKHGGPRKPSALERNGQRKASAAERNGQRKAAGENAPTRRYAPPSPKGGGHERGRRADVAPVDGRGRRADVAPVDGRGRRADVAPVDGRGRRADASMSPPSGRRCHGVTEGSKPGARTGFRRKATEGSKPGARTGGKNRK